jgi:hypothetical protein
MPNNNQEYILFALTKDDVLACAKEIGIAKERVTDEVIKLIENRLEAEFGRWPEIVKETITRATQCPLGLNCFPSCCWWKEGRCIFPQ